MKERSDDAILVFSLRCPAPSCHNVELEFQKGKDVGRKAERWHQKGTAAQTFKNHISLIAPVIGKCAS